MTTTLSTFLPTLMKGIGALIIGTGLMASPALSQNMDLAPPAFGPGNSYVPMDISTIVIDYVYNVGRKSATGKAKITFTLDKKGKPFFDVVPKITSASLNGKSFAVANIKTVGTPGGDSKLRVVDQTLEADKEHTIDVAFDLSSAAKFGSGTVNIGYFMTDLSDRGYFEKYGPTNLQFDQIQYTFNVKVEGTSKAHEVFANGDITAQGENSWSVVFPDFYNCSSIFFHLVPAGTMTKKESTFQSKGGAIPVLVYKKSGSVDKFMSRTLSKLKSLENRFGATTHKKYVIYIAGSGGMEYSGATMTSSFALNHEITHSWFARGVHPNNGNSGWMDEAIASWQDDKYKRARSGPKGPSVNLSGFSVYKRATSRKSYSEGKTLVSQLDYMFRNKGGMTKVLKKMYEQHGKGVTSTEEFKKLIEDETGEDMTRIFNRYVYGKADFEDEFVDYEADPQPIAEPKIPSKHPRQYTEAELWELM